MNRQSETSARKALASQVLFLFLSLTVGMFLTGCSDSHTSQSDNPTTPSISSAKHPFHDPPLKMIGESTGGGGLKKALALEGEGESGGLCSWLIHTLEEGLTEGITHFIGDNTTGSVLNGIKSHLGDSGADAQFVQLSDQLTSIGTQLTAVQHDLKDLLTQLKLATAQILTNEDQIALTGYYANITAAFNGPSSSYMYIAKQAKGADLTNTTTVANLQKLATTYNNTYTTAGMSPNLIGLHDLVVKDKILHAYATQIILLNSPGTDAMNSADAITTAENGYLLLQQKFSEILNYQIQALIIIAELDNYNDPTGAATRNDITFFQGYLKEEVAQFLTEVDYLMLNLVDYRNSSNYTNDSGSMYAHGLVHDATYAMVFATSRAFCAQLIGTGTLLTDSTGSTSFQPDFGLHGSVVIPNYYAPVAIPTPALPTSPVTTRPINLSFTPYTTSSDGARQYIPNSTVYVTAQPTPGASQFPYTAWNTNNQSFPDNNWLMYEFTAANDLPAGTYAITLVDSGDANTPWYHNTTDFGTVSVLYYNPSNFSDGGTLVDGGTLSPIGPKTFKFSSFSGRWNWGYNSLSMSPMTAWKLPAKNTIQTLPSNQVAPVEDNPSFKNAPAGYSYYPHTDFSAGVHALGLKMPSTTSNFPIMMYTIELPFIVGSLPTGSTGAAQLYYSTAATVNLAVSETKSNSYAYYDFNLINNTGKSKTVSIDNYASSTHSISSTSKFNNILNSTLVPGDYQLSVDAGLNNWVDSKATTSGAIDLSWNMQIVYTNTYPSAVQ